MSQDSSCVFSLGYCYLAGCREVTWISSVIFPITCLVYRTHCNCFSVFLVILMVSTAFLLSSVLSRESERYILRCPEEPFHSCCSLRPPVSKSSRPLSLPPHLIVDVLLELHHPLNSPVLPSVNFSHSLQKGNFLQLAQKAAWVLLGRAGLLEEHHPTLNTNFYLWIFVCLFVF